MFFYVYKISSLLTNVKWWKGHGAKQTVMKNRETYIDD